MSSTLRLQTLEGAAIAGQVRELGALRARVFADWPYLYAASQDYEAHYLQVYLDSPRSYAVLAWDGERCVGATTALPLSDGSAETQQPFREHGYAIETIFYFGESVVLPSYRKQGLGARFFDLREERARRHGLSLCAFCSVDRPDDHPAKPVDYRPNDHFWRTRGYQKAPQLKSMLAWRDIGADVATAKSMTFWLRDIGA